MSSYRKSLHGMTLDQLQEEKLRIKRSIFALRFQKANGQLEKTSEVRRLRRDFAGILTIIGEKNVTNDDA